MAADPNIDPDEIVVVTRTYTYLADVGTAMPTDLTAALGTGWHGVGLTTEDSLSFSVQPEFQEVKSAQDDYPTKTFQTSEAGSVSVDLQQWNASNFQAAYGGGTVEVVSGGTNVYKFTPPTLGGRKEKACVIEVTNGTHTYRYCFPRVMQREGVQADLQKGKEGTLPLRLAIQGSGAAAPWFMLTNDPAFAPAA